MKNNKIKLGDKIQFNSYLDKCRIEDRYLHGERFFRTSWNLEECLPTEGIIIGIRNLYEGKTHREDDVNLFYRETILKALLVVTSIYRNPILIPYPESI